MKLKTLILNAQSIDERIIRECVNLVNSTVKSTGVQSFACPQMLLGEEDECNAKLVDVFFHCGTETAVIEADASSFDEISMYKCENGLCIEFQYSDITLISKTRNE
jgi:hypothetical protein